jgi:hypothetical protein
VRGAGQSVRSHLGGRSQSGGFGASAPERPAARSRQASRASAPSTRPSSCDRPRSARPASCGDRNRAKHPARSAGGDGAHDRGAIVPVDCVHRVKVEGRSFPPISAAAIATPHRRSGLQVGRSNFIATTTMFVRYRKIKSDGFEPGGVAAKIACAGPCQRRARHQCPMKPRCRWRIGLGEDVCEIIPYRLQVSIIENRAARSDKSTSPISAASRNTYCRRFGRRPAPTFSPRCGRTIGISTLCGRG